MTDNTAAVKMMLVFMVEPQRAANVRRATVNPGGREAEVQSSFGVFIRTVLRKQYCFLSHMHMKIRACVWCPGITGSCEFKMQVFYFCSGFVDY